MRHMLKLCRRKRLWLKRISVWVKVKQSLCKLLNKSVEKCSFLLHIKGPLMCPSPASRFNKKYFNSGKKATLFKWFIWVYVNLCLNFTHTEILFNRSLFLLHIFSICCISLDNSFMSANDIKTYIKLVHSLRRERIYILNVYLLDVFIKFGSTFRVNFCCHTWQWEWNEKNHVYFSPAWDCILNNYYRNSFWYCQFGCLLWSLKTVVLQFDLNYSWFRKHILAFY